MPEPDDLVGLFVVEVGERQAWPFIQFCDNAPTPSREVRLYIDATFDVDVADAAGSEEPLVRLLALNNLSVTSVDVAEMGLAIGFHDGSRLRVSGEAESWTIGDVWWLSPWLS